MYFSYYHLAKVEAPSVYSMETQEIVNKLENIVTETIPNSSEWLNQSVQDLVVKYKVRLDFFCRKKYRFCAKIQSIL